MARFSLMVISTGQIFVNGETKNVTFPARRTGRRREKDYPAGRPAIRSTVAPPDGPAAIRRKVFRPISEKIFGGRNQGISVILLPRPYRDIPGVPALIEDIMKRKSV